MIFTVSPHKEAGPGRYRVTCPDLGSASVALAKEWPDGSWSAWAKGARFADLDTLINRVALANNVRVYRYEVMS